MKRMKETESKRNRERESYEKSVCIGNDTLFSSERSRRRRRRWQEEECIRTGHGLERERRK